MTRKMYVLALSRYGTNVLFGYWSYLELGCPKGSRGVPRGELSTLQSVAADNVASELLEFIRPVRNVAVPALGGGRKRLAHALDALAQLQVGYQVTGDPSTTALPVVPERVALPEVGGVIDPASALDPHLRPVFNNWERHVRLPPDHWPLPRPKCCHTLERKHEFNFIRGLLKRSMGKLVPASDLPRDPYTGQIVTSGFFCVGHKVDFDRLIQDKRAQNETERHLDWIHLPCGNQLGQIFLKRGETPRGSADDFETYFYSVRGPPGSEVWGAVGRSWDAASFSKQELGNVVPSSGPVYFCMTVPGMGGRNSMDLCQAVHEGMLHQADCLRPGESLRYRLPIPKCNTFEGAYADDHIVIQRLTVEELKSCPLTIVMVRECR